MYMPYKVIAHSERDLIEKVDFEEEERSEKNNNWKRKKIYIVKHIELKKNHLPTIKE